MLSSLKKSCGVAFPIECNSATSDTNNATTTATTVQPTGLKALASKVLERNNLCNVPATTEKTACNFLTATNRFVETFVTSENDYSPAPCQGCNKLEVLVIAGNPVAGCISDLENGPWREEWQRLPANLQKCIFH